MKELKTLTIRERVNISVQCEPIFLVMQKRKQFQPVFDVIKGELTKKYDKEVWLMVTILCKSIRYNNKGSRVPMNNNLYATANKVHGQSLSIKRLKHVIESLEYRGLLEFYKGYYNSAEDSMSSCILFSDKLLCNLNIPQIKRLAAKRDPLSFVEVKTKGENGEVVYLSLQDFRGYSTYVKKMEKYNELLSKSSIQMYDGQNYVDCNVIYKREFFDNFQGAGRFYSLGKFQTNKSEYRKHLIVNNTPVTEVDYCNLHPRLLYTLEGIELPDGWDAYEIEGLSWVSDKPKDVRNFLKKSYLSVLFSKDKQTAIMSVLNSANKRKHIHISNKVSATKVVDSIIDKNGAISKYFFEENLWSKLQNMDSRLADSVIFDFINQGKVCLGWHDSFVVERDYQQELIQSMKEAWFSLFGTYMNFKIDVEF